MQADAKYITSSAVGQDRSHVNRHHRTQLHQLKFMYIRSGSTFKKSSQLQTLEFRTTRHLRRVT